MSFSDIAMFIASMMVLSSFVKTQKREKKEAIYYRNFGVKQ